MTFQVSVLLSSSFSGGGTVFWSELNTSDVELSERFVVDSLAPEHGPAIVLHPAVGTAILWNGRVWHSGAAVSRGVRHLLVQSFNVLDAETVAPPSVVHALASSHGVARMMWHDVTFKRECPMSVNATHDYVALKYLIDELDARLRGHWFIQGGILINALRFGSFVAQHDGRNFVADDDFDFFYDRKYHSEVRAVLDGMAAAVQGIENTTSDGSHGSLSLWLHVDRPPSIDRPWLVRSRRHVD